MRKSSAERIADFRARRKAEGVVQVSLMVPAGDVELFRRFAAERVEGHHNSGLKRPPPESSNQHWLAMLDTLGVVRDDEPRPTDEKRTQGTRATRAEELLATLIGQISRLGWPLGMPLGSEAELMKTHGVSRAVLRQTIRL